MPRVVAALAQRAPAAGRAGPSPHDTRPLPPLVAMRERYWTANRPGTIAVVMVDVDHNDMYGPIMAGLVLPPSFLVHHGDTGHGQVGYLLRDGVPRRRGAALDFLNDVRPRLVAAWQADPAYRGSLSSGPLAISEGRLLEVLRPDPVTLADIAGSLAPTPRADLMRAAFDATAGRNCALFEVLRHEAYAYARRDLSGLGLKSFLISRAEALNALLSQPMSAREVAGIVQSIAGWTLRHMDELTRRTPQRRKGARLPGANRLREQLPQEREVLAPEQQRANMSAGGAMARQNVREATRGRIRGAVTLLQRQGQPITTAALVAASGLSRATVKRHADLYREGPGTP